MPQEELSSGTGDGLQSWLEQSGLVQYHDLFVRHRIDLDILADLTEADLSELGLPLGDRRRLQRAISLLRSPPPADTAGGGRPAASRTTVLAERRQLTVMFCD